ncbi:MAG: ferredoxin [Candidatus Kerfeldbacteria bacterium]|nr:ferredoxin [Candidatus Kerfeldbacteria bacterium]
MSDVPVPKITRIEVDRELCIGAATCVAVAPELFELDEENKAIVKPAHGADQAAILNAAKVCPVLAIYLYGEDGKKIYPAP